MRQAYGEKRLVVDIEKEFSSTSVESNGGATARDLISSGSI